MLQLIVLSTFRRTGRTTDKRQVRITHRSAYCRYGLRPAFSHRRLSLSEAGQVQLALRRPWPNAGGVSVLSFDPVAFLRRLAPLIPPPYANLVRHFGLFAPNAKGRDLLPAAPVSPAGLRLVTELRAQSERRGDPAAPPEQPQAAMPPPVMDAGLPTTSGPPPAACSAPAARDPASLPRPPGTERAAGRTRRTALPCAELLRRVFAIDVLVCPSCLGPMTVITFLTEASVVEKILTHLGMLASPPPLAPARRPGQLDLFDAPPSDRGCALSRPCPAARAPPRDQSDGSADDSGDIDTSFDWGA